MSEREGRKSLVIVQPYVPAYRVRFFEKLIEQLATLGIDCVVAADSPGKEMVRRGDSAEAPWIHRTRTRSLRLFGGTIALGSSRRAWKHADAVVVGHLGTSLDTYLAIWNSIRGRRAAGVWGHIDSYVNTSNPLDSLLEKWQLRHADHIFAYTVGGADYAVKNGARVADVTTVMNAVDTASLVDAVSNVTDTEVRDFGVKHRLESGNVVAFIGGLDFSKRIDFLAEVLDEMWETNPEIRVLVGGLGEQQGLLDRSIQRNQVLLMGYLDDRAKALVGRWASAILMPGRIGLVAVDALILKTPIITTNWPFHAPESEYLTLGLSRFDAPNVPSDYAEYVKKFMATSHPDMSGCAFPTLEDMVRNFSDGVVRLMDGPSSHKKAKSIATRGVARPRS